MCQWITVSKAYVHNAFVRTLQGVLASAQAFLLDAHSMKSRGNATTPDGPGSLRPDVVVGDLDGAACTPRLTECVVETLRGRGYSVKVRDGQARGSERGGATPMRWVPYSVHTDRVQ